jgi:hypothetical protein
MALDDFLRQPATNIPGAVSSPNETCKRTPSVVLKMALIVARTIIPPESLTCTRPALRTMLNNFAARNWPELGLHRQSLG